MRFPGLSLGSAPSEITPSSLELVDLAMHEYGLAVLGFGDISAVRAVILQEELARHVLDRSVPARHEAVVHPDAAVVVSADEARHRLRVDCTRGHRSASSVG